MKRIGGRVPTLTLGAVLERLLIVPERMARSVGLASCTDADFTDPQGITEVEGQLDELEFVASVPEVAGDCFVCHTSHSTTAVKWQRRNRLPMVGKG